MKIVFTYMYMINKTTFSKRSNSTDILKKKSADNKIYCRKRIALYLSSNMAVDDTYKEKIE